MGNSIRTRKSERNPSPKCRRAKHRGSWVFGHQDKVKSGETHGGYVEEKLDSLVAVWMSCIGLGVACCLLKDKVCFMLIMIGENKVFLFNPPILSCTGVCRCVCVSPAVSSDPHSSSGKTRRKLSHADCRLRLKFHEQEREERKNSRRAPA